MLRFLSANRWKKNGINYIKEKNRINIIAKGVDIKIANEFLKKIFNDTYNIVSFDISKSSKRKLDFKMEIKW